MPKLAHLRGWSSALLTAILMAMLGCAGSQPQPSAITDADTPIPATLLSQLPPLAQLDGALPRTATEVTEATQDGSDALLLSPGAMVTDTSLVISSAADQLEYGIYGFDTGLTETGTFDAGAAISLSPGGEAWAAIADYDNRRWKVSGPYVGDVDLSLTDGVYLSPAGSFYLALLAYGGSEVTVASTSFTFDNGVAPPAPTWLADVKAVFDAKCISCHGGGSPVAGVALDSYRGARDNSALVITKSVVGSHMGLTQPEKDAVTGWVDGGTPYGAAVTYTADVRPIIQATCGSCHTTSSVGGINLNTYANASMNAAASLAEILADSMPPGTPLSSGDKDLWQVWIDDGKPE